MGTGAMFTAIYRRYDLIICWQPSNGTVQRLTNALATGVPVIARRMQAYEQAFGLNSVFNMRSLSMQMESNFELPVVKQMRLEQMRQNVSKLQRRDVVVDTILGRDYHAFKGGMIDWSFSSYQANNEVNNRAYLGLGSELLYGQATVSIVHDDRYEFDSQQLYYNWRWVDNEKKVIRIDEEGEVFCILQSNPCTTNHSS